MNKKILITSALLTLALFGCRKEVPSSSTNSSEASSFVSSDVSEDISSELTNPTSTLISGSSLDSSINSENNSSSLSEDSSVDISSSSSTIQKEVFITPVNLLIEDNILTWDEVENAPSYNIKIVLSDQSEHNETSSTNSFDLSRLDYFTKGIHSISVRVNGDDYHYISSYSSIVEYIYGIDQTKVNEFVSGVNQITNVTLESKTDLNQLLDKYNQLDEIDVLDEKCIEAKNTFAKFQGEYLLLLTQTINIFDNNDIVQEEKIIEAKQFYDQCLNKQDEKVIASLNIPVDYVCSHNELKFTKDKTNTYIEYYGINIIEEKISLDNLSLIVDGKEVSLTKENNYYLAQIEKSGEIQINGKKFDEVNVIEAIDNSLTNLEVKENLNSKTKVYTYNKNVSEDLSVLIFDSNSISINGDFPIINDGPLGSFNTSNDYFTNKEIYDVIKDSDKQVSSYSLLLTTMNRETGNISYSLINELCLNQKVEPLELKLDNPILVDEITPDNLKFNEDGSIAYRWELITNNIEINAGISSGIEFVFFDENSEINEENIIARYKVDNPKFITSSDINNALIKSQIPSNSTLKVGIRFLSDNPNYLSSDIVIVEGTHTYELDYSLPNYYLQHENNFLVRESGELAYYFEAFMDVNPVASEIDHLEVWVLDRNTSSITLEEESSSKVKGKFNIYYSSISHTDTSKKAIESILFEMGLKSGSYCFVSRFITKDNSLYSSSALSNITNSFNYEVMDLSSVNLVGVSKTIVLTNELENNNLIELMDDNPDSRYIASNTDNGTLEDVYLIIDLKKIYNLDHINILWEGAFAKKYSIYGISEFDKENFDISNLSSWTLINQVENRTDYLPSEEITISQDTSARYILLHLEERGTPYPYSLYEFEVYAK